MVCPTGPKSSTVANISPRLVHPGASEILPDSNFSDNNFLSQLSVCCNRSSSSSFYSHFTTGINANTSADTKAGFLIKKPLCCLLKDGNISEVFFCTVASCEDGVGEHAPEQDIGGNIVSYARKVNQNLFVILPSFSIATMHLIYFSLRFCYQLALGE